MKQQIVLRLYQLIRVLYVLQTPSESHPKIYYMATYKDRNPMTIRVQFDLDVYGSVHHSTDHIEITNKMQPCTYSMEQSPS
jgi:hypothetical protein